MGWHKLHKFRWESVAIGYLIDNQSHQRPWWITAVPCKTASSTSNQRRRRCRRHQSKWRDGDSFWWTKIHRFFPLSIPVSPFSAFPRKLKYLSSYHFSLILLSVYQFYLSLSLSLSFFLSFLKLFVIWNPTRLDWIAVVLFGACHLNFNCMDLLLRATNHALHCMTPSEWPPVTPADASNQNCFEFIWFGYLLA